MVAGWASGDGGVAATFVRRGVAPSVAPTAWLRLCGSRRLVAPAEREERGVPLFSRPAERGPALATSRRSGKSGDKSPHSKILAPREDCDGLQYSEIECAR